MAAVNVIGGEWFLALAPRGTPRIARVFLTVLGGALVSPWVHDGIRRIMAPGLRRHDRGHSVSAWAASDALPCAEPPCILRFGGHAAQSSSVLNPELIAATLAIILIVAGSWAIVLVLGYPLKTARSVCFVRSANSVHPGDRGAGFVPGGRDASLGGRRDRFISINPLIYHHRSAHRLAVAFEPPVGSNRRRTHKLDDHEPEDDTPSPYRAVIIGYGPIGRTLVRLLLENEVEPTVIDLNFEAVQLARRQGIKAVYGDTTQPDTLREAQTALSGTLILSASNLTGSAEVIRLARLLNPKIRVLARVGYVAELRALRNAGADVVFSGEGEVALALTTAMLGELGATGEQIDPSGGSARNSSNPVIRREVT